MQLTDMINRVRLEVGDPYQPFKTSTLGDGMTSLYDLPKQNLDPVSFTVTVVNGASLNELVLGTDFIINDELGMVELTTPVPNGATLIMQGNAWGMFTDDDLMTFVNDSVNQHCYNRVIEERIRTSQGFIAYRNTPMTLTNLPVIEEPLLVMLSCINVFWTLANDASTDTDIVTAEGTNVNRIARYQQLMSHIADLQERYERYCGQLNVGVFRWEVLRLRRVSRTTNRLIPVFTDREYDDHTWPTRELSPVDQHNADDSGIPSPLWNAQGM
jgi:hypothetical protein